MEKIKKKILFHNSGCRETCLEFKYE